MDQIDSNPGTEPEPEWERIRPVLDEAMADLNESDRDALLLRFFKSRDFRAIGQALGITDDAAQKRVTRALDKLRAEFVRRGVTTTALALSSTLSANAVTAAPAGMVTIFSTSGLVGAAALSTAATTTTTTAVKTIAMTVLQKSIVGTMLVAAIGVGVYEARKASRLHDENQNLKAEFERMVNAGKTVSMVNASTGNEQFEKDKSELLRWRNEVSMLRQQTNELAKLRDDNRQLQQVLAEAQELMQQKAEDPGSVPARLAAMAKISDSRLLALGLIMYASNNQDQLPTSLNQTSNYWNAGGEWRLTGTNHFDLVATGLLSRIPNPSEVIVVREVSPSFVRGKWVKAYGFADGHAEYTTEPPEGFDAWEKQHMFPPVAE